MSAEPVPTPLSPHRFAQRIPPLSERDYAALRDDVAANGQRVPIVLYLGQVLDGVHRARVCDDLGIEPLCETFQGSELDALALVVSLNLRRRHLSKDVLAAIGVEELLDDQRAAAKARQQEAGQTYGRGQVPLEVAEPIDEPEAVEQVAKTVGVGKSKVQAAAKVRDADPELFDEVATGKTTLADATTMLDDREAERDPEYAAAVAVKRANDALTALMRATHALGHRADLEVALRALSGRKTSQLDEYRQRVGRARTVLDRIDAALAAPQLRRVK